MSDKTNPSRRGLPAAGILRATDEENSQKRDKNVQDQRLTDTTAQPHEGHTTAQPHEGRSERQGTSTTGKSWINLNAVAFTPSKYQAGLPNKTPIYEYNPQVPLRPQYETLENDSLYDPYDNYESFVNKYKGYSQDEMFKYFGQIHGTYEQPISSLPKDPSGFAFGAQTPSKTPKKPDGAPVFTYNLPFGKYEIPFGSPLYEKMLQQKGMDGEPQEEGEVVIQPWDIQGVRRQYRTLDSVQTPIGTTVDFHQFINLSRSIRNIIKTTEETVFKMAYHVPEEVYSTYSDFLENSRRFLDKVKEIEAGRGTEEAGLQRAEVRGDVVKEGFASKSNIDVVQAQLEKQLSLAPSDRKPFGSSTDDSREIESVDPGAPSSSGQVSYSAAAARNLSEIVERKTQEQSPKTQAKPLPTSSIAQRKTPILTNPVQREPKTPSVPKRDEQGFEFPTPKRTARRLEEQVTPKKSLEKLSAAPAKLVTVPQVCPQTPDLTNEEIDAMSEDEFNAEVAESERRERIKHRMSILRHPSTKARLAKNEAADREKHLKKKINIWTERLIAYKREHEKREAVRSVQLELSKSDPTEYVRKVRALPPFQQDVVRCFNARRKRPADAIERATKFATTRQQVYKSINDPNMASYWQLILENMDTYFADDVNYLRAVGEFYKVDEEELQRFDRCYLNLVFNKKYSNKIESCIQNIKSSDMGLNMSTFKEYLKRREKWIRLDRESCSESDFKNLPMLERVLFERQRYVEGLDVVQACVRLKQAEIQGRKILEFAFEFEGWDRAFQFLCSYPLYVVALDISCLHVISRENEPTDGETYEDVFVGLVLKYMSHTLGMHA